MPHNDKSNALREQFLIAMDNGNSEVLRSWAMSDSPNSLLSWQMLHEAWAQSKNKSMLSWELLHECIELAHDYSISTTKTRLSTLHGFSAWLDTPHPYWISQLDENQARACAEKAVSWIRQGDKDGAYSMQALQTSMLMQLSIGCKQGRIWKEYPDLQVSPLEPRYPMRYTEAARCTEAAVYDALWWHKQIEMTKPQWKLEMVLNGQMHNLRQISTTPFCACEYVIEQHAQASNHSSYAQIIKPIQFSQLNEVDAWMLRQLANPSGTWPKAQCPLPEDTQIQSWWYLLQLGVDDDALLQSLQYKTLDTTVALALPEDSFMPQESLP